uniref:Membrane-associated lipoprotein n=1 Tax=Mycoplasma feriruminatoris TaxID=1179777 RepID=A0A654ICA8_9MOLU|nr:Membrane-associated lipoprotein [Mycoplasma feriruminatoris]
MLKKLLTILSSATLLSSSLLIVSCSNKLGKSSNNRFLTEQEFNKIIDSINDSNDLEKLAELSFNNGRNKKDQILPSALQDNSSILSVKFKGDYKDKIKVTVNNVSTISGQNLNLSNTQGTAEVSLTFTNVSNGKYLTKKIMLSGLQRNGGADQHGRIVGNQYAYFGPGDGFEKYLKMDLQQRFDFDNKKYIEILERTLQADNKNKLDTIKKQRGITIKDSDIEKFDKLAKDVKFDSYYNAALKGFTLPVYSDNGEVQGLKVLDAPEIGKGPSIIDSLGRNPHRTNGLARTIPNEIYKNIATQTFQVSFRSPNLYEDEIEEATEFITKIRSWSDEEFKSYMAIQIRNLEIEFNYQNDQIDIELKSTKEEQYPGHIKQLNDKKEELKKKFDEDKKKLEGYKKDDLTKWQEKEIENYKEKAKDQQNISYKPISGTMWILDHQLPTNGNNSNKFYFGTNSHVAKAITDKLSSMSLTRIDKNVGVGQTLRLNALDPNFKTFHFSNFNKDAVNVIFHATNFIKKEQRPTEFLEPSQKAKFKDTGIYADFAVIEIDFDKLLSKYSSGLETTNSDFWIESEQKPITEKYKNKKIKDLVTEITNGYADLNDKDKVKFKSSSYLENNNYDSINRIISLNPDNQEELKKFKELESLFVLGYPSAKDDYYFKKYEDENQELIKKDNFSLWTNSDQRYYEQVSRKEGYPSKFPEYVLNKGEFLSYQIGYRSFIDKPGLTDAFLASSRVGNKLYKLKGKEYFQYGLQIMPRFYAPSGGASGSSVRNNKNELIGVFHAANNSAKTGLAAVFRSPGYDYKKLFGDYNLVEYDLIYGGAKHQVNSYRFELFKNIKMIQTLKQHYLAKD